MGVEVGCVGEVVVGKSKVGSWRSEGCKEKQIKNKKKH
jgi:hypothetical protein